jgi:hypothetical protein
MPLLKGAQYISAAWASCLFALVRRGMRAGRAQRLT